MHCACVLLHLSPRVAAAMCVTQPRAVQRRRGCTSRVKKTDVCYTSYMRLAGSLKYNGSINVGEAQQSSVRSWTTPSFHLASWLSVGTVSGLQRLTSETRIDVRERRSCCAHRKTALISPVWFGLVLFLCCVGRSPCRSSI